MALSFKKKFFPSLSIFEKYVEKIITGFPRVRKKKRKFAMN